MKRVLDWLAARQETGVALAGVLFAAVLWTDHRTGDELGLSLLYLAPVFLASLVLGARSGVAAALAAGACWHALNSPSHESALVQAWNTLSRTGFFLLSAASARAYLRMREAQRLTELKSSMLSVVSHDLNNFTTVLQMAVALLEESEAQPGPDRARAYSVLKDNIGKIGQTVRDFLDMARLESGRFELRPERVMLKPFARALADDLAFALEKKSLELTLDLPEHSLPVRADPGVMKMVMGNLLSNAIKYTPTGGRVAIRLRRLGDGRAEVSVEDSGIGISPEDQKKVFSGFYRTQIAKDAAPGQGLGLKLTREMVALHGGELRLDSSPERGSRFSFTLPLWDPAEPAERLFLPGDGGSTAP